MGSRYERLWCLKIGNVMNTTGSGNGISYGGVGQSIRSTDTNLMKVDWVYNKIGERVGSLGKNVNVDSIKEPVRYRSTWVRYKNSWDYQDIGGSEKCNPKKTKPKESS